MFVKNIKKNNSGFTVIELIVSASIIAIMSILVVANFRGNTQKVVLENEAERLAAVLRQAHIDSLIGTTVGNPKARPAGGFGLYFSICTGPSKTDPCEYMIFADLDANHQYDSGVDEEIQTIKTFSNEIEFSQPSIGDDAFVVFVPPEGQIFFNNGTIDIGDETASFYINYRDTSYSKTITINQLTGQIEIN